MPALTTTRLVQAPAATATDFSFERDVQPYYSRFFGEVSANPNLSSAARTRLQSGILDGAAAIQDREFKVREELDQQRSRRLAYETGVTALEEARARRSRAEQAQAQIGGVHALASGIVASKGTPEEKQAALAQAALDHAPMLALNPDAAQIFGIAKDAIPERPKGLISNAEMFSSILKGIPQEELRHASETGDFSRLTGIAQQIDDAEYLRREQLKAVSGASKDAEDLRMKLLTRPLTFTGAKDEMGNKTDSPWLEPESTEQAKVLVAHFGTPEEQKKFETLRTAESDKDRALIVAQIQNRELLKRMGGAAAGGRRSASSITGLK